LLVSNVSLLLLERDYLMIEDVACGCYIPLPHIHAHTYTFDILLY